MWIATQDWWCRTFQWGCHGGQRMGEAAPEISIAGLVGGLCLTIAALLYVAGRPRRP